MKKENQESFLTVNSLRAPHLILMLLSLSMSLVSLYLIKHYFNAHYPEGLATTSMCNLNSFFSCDAATYSAISSLFGVPIALFGFLWGTILFLSTIFPSKEIEATNKVISLLNAIGCLLLLFYSLIVLRSLCPFCTIYYILSFITYYLFHRYSPKGELSKKILGIYTVLLLIVSGISTLVTQSKIEANQKLAPSLISQYDSNPKLGSPATDLPYRLASSTEQFKDAAIQVTIFSDFQCPACKMLSESMEPIFKRYQGKINIQYSFYPLDQACNPHISRAMHEYACYAAALATCVTPAQFKEVHDTIFHNQENLSRKFVDDLASKYGVVDCLKNPATNEKLVAIVKGSDPFSISSTPTMLVNGVKIEGVLPTTQLFILFDELIKRHEKRN